MTTRVADELADGSTCKWSKVLEGGRVGSCSSYDNGVGHSTLLTQGLHERSYGRALLADGYVDAIYGIACFVVILLVDDGIDGDGRLTCLAVTNDKLTLATSDRNHGIDGLQTGLQRLLYRLTEHNARGLALQWHLEFLARYRAHAVEWFAEWVDDTAKHILIHLDRGDAVGALHHHAFTDLLRSAEEHGTHIVFLQVHDDGHDTVFEFQQLVHLSIAQAVDTGHTVTDGQHGSDFVETC